MRQFLTGVAVVGLSLFAIESVQAGGKGHPVGHGNSTYPHHAPTASIWCDPNFNYALYGVATLNYTNQSWNEIYGCYQYWCPATSCWYFYAPAYSCYVPCKHYSVVLRPIYPVRSGKF